MSIRFGTEGWRGIIADDFTFENVRRMSIATGMWLQEKFSTPSACVSYDRRFMSEEFAKICAQALSQIGVETLLSSRYTPTPALSFYVYRKKLSAGIMITASHNPYRYNGYKVKNSFGGPIANQEAESILRYFDKLTREVAPLHSQADVREVDFFEEYVNALLEMLTEKRLYLDSVIVDAMHGSGGGWLSEVLKRLDLDVTELRADEDPTFERAQPEPKVEFLQELIHRAKDEKKPAFALDGDADRIAAVDERGRFVNSHHVFALLLRHLVENRKLRGVVVKTLTTSDMIDNLCRKYGLTLKVTPVGFKYPSRIMVEEGAILAGEESGGIGTSLHIPERDGSACALLLLEYMSFAGKHLYELVDELHSFAGEFFFKRVDLKVHDLPSVWRRVKENYHALCRKFHLKLETDVDGFKFRGDGIWLVLRKSGTEPLIRMYSEGESEDSVNRLLEGVKDFLLQ